MPDSAFLVETTDNPAPPGFVADMIAASDGILLRVARWQPAGASAGTVLIANGRSEFIEKYFEVIGELLARGLHVVTFDWRGQGFSGRELPNPRKGHIDDFSLYGRDLVAVQRQVMDEHCPKPWFALGHSMGGAILLAQSAHLDVERMVLSAPMIGLSGLRFPKGARMLAHCLDMIGLGGAFIPGGGETAYLTKPFPGNVLTSDAARYARIADIAALAPGLAVGAPTVGWINAAFRQMQQFGDPDFALRIAIPTLIMAAGDDRVVDTLACERLGAGLKGGGVIVVAQARHEILIERDAFRSQFWAAFDAFVPGTRAELAAFAGHGAKVGAKVGTKG